MSTLHTFLLTATLTALVFLAYPVQAVVSQYSPSQSSLAFGMSRNTAYYLAGIPGPNGQSLLWFDFTVNASTRLNRPGVLLYSHNGVGWSNLQEFQFRNGTASGRQTIDSTWAVPGGNYLRVAYNQTLSNPLVLTVFVNYFSVIGISVLPYFLTIVIVLGAILSWRRHQ